MIFQNYKHDVKRGFINKVMILTLNVIQLNF